MLDGGATYSGSTGLVEEILKYRGGGGGGGADPTLVDAATYAAAASYYCNYDLAFALSA